MQQTREDAASRSVRKARHGHEARALDRPGERRVVERFESLRPDDGGLTANAPRMCGEPEQKLREMGLELVESEAAPHEPRLIEADVQEPSRECDESLLGKRASTVEIVSSGKVGIVESRVIAFPITSHSAKWGPQSSSDT